MISRTRPFGIAAATRYAIRAAMAYYRFARTRPEEDVLPDGLGLVVSSRNPSQEEMDTLGSAWSDWSRVQGAQPSDPAVIWSDRSQFRGWFRGQRTRVLREAHRTEGATHRTEAATGSHNNSHNAPAHVLDRTPLKLLVCVKGCF